MSSSYLLWLVTFLLIHTSHAQVYCASGYHGSNVYLYGKTTYFRGFDSNQEYYASSTAPVESDRFVYIWKNSTDACYYVLTLADGNQGKDIPSTAMTTHARCTECNIDLLLCPSWDIFGDGFHHNFTVVNNNNKRCQTDNWMLNNTLQTPQHQPPDVCMHNTDQYNSDYNDINFELFAVDISNNPYYYHHEKGQYIRQYHDTTHDQWYWLQSDIISTHTQSGAYCAITSYPNESITDCAPWFYQNPSNTSQYLVYDMIIDDHDCNFPSDTICVYDSTLPYSTFKKEINGEYSLWSATNAYDGFQKGTGGLIYIRFVNHTWKFGYNHRLDPSIYSTCNNKLADTQINPFDITSCNGYWQLFNASCCDSLTISNTPCATRPTRAPTHSPTNAPSVSPTAPPSAAPSFSPTVAPSTAPSITPTRYPSFAPTLNPSHAPTFMPSKAPTASPVVSTLSPTVGIVILSTEVENNPSKVKVITFWDNFKTSSDNFVLVIGVLSAIAFLCFAIAIAVYCGCKRKKRKKKDLKRKELKEERDTFREQITMDVSQKVTTAVTETVAKTTKEVLLESLHGSVYMSSPSNAKREGYDYVPHKSPSKQRYHSHPSKQRRPESYPLHVPPNHHHMQHLSPNYQSSTIPRSSPAPKQSIESPSGIIYNVPISSISPYHRSNAVLSPDRHNSPAADLQNTYIDSADSSHPNIVKHMHQTQYMMYGDAHHTPQIPVAHHTHHEMLQQQHMLHGDIVDDSASEYPQLPQDVSSVNYHDADIEEKANRASNRHKQKMDPKQLAYEQPDIFPDDIEGAETQTHEKEGYDGTARAKSYADAQSVAYNQVKQVENRLVIRVNEAYNTDSERDEEEKVCQNRETIGDDIEMIAPQNAPQVPSIIEMPAYERNEYRNKQHDNMNDEEYIKLMEKVMLDKSSSVGDEENDEVGPLNAFQQNAHLSPIDLHQRVNKSSKRKSTSEMSASHQTGISFMTLVNEQKQIEISQDIEDDDGLQDVVDDDDDDDEEDEDEHEDDDDEEDVVESSPLLSGHNNNINSDNELEYEAVQQMNEQRGYNEQYGDVSSHVTDETEEYATHAQYPAPHAINIANRKNKHHVIPSDSVNVQNNFQYEVESIENPFSVDSDVFSESHQKNEAFEQNNDDNESYTNAVNDDGVTRSEV